MLLSTPPCRFRTGDSQPWLVTAAIIATAIWHVVIPVFDDATHVVLLWSTANSANLALWWICLAVLILTGVERLWLFVTLCVTFPLLLPLLGCCTLANECFCSENDVMPATRKLGLWFARLNCTYEAPEGTLRGRIVDTLLWTLLGSRARSSPLWGWGTLRLSGNAHKTNIHDSGVGFGAIDQWVSRHPFRWLGEKLFGPGFKVKGRDDDTVTRRAEIMLRAVGETLVVDPLFLVLSVMTGGWDGGLTGVAGLSAVFSALELLTELQFYIQESGKELQPSRSLPAVVVRHYDDSMDDSECASVGSGVPERAPPV